MLNFLFIVLVLILAANAIAPRTLWWTLSSWRYRNPDANEPSDSAFMAGRIVAIVLLIAVIVVRVTYRA